MCTALENRYYVELNRLFKRILNYLYKKNQFYLSYVYKNRKLYSINLTIKNLISKGSTTLLLMKKQGIYRSLCFYLACVNF